MEVDHEEEIPQISLQEMLEDLQIGDETASGPSAQLGE